MLCFLFAFLFSWAWLNETVFIQSLLCTCVLIRFVFFQIYRIYPLFLGLSKLQLPAHPHCRVRSGDTWLKILHRRCRVRSRARSYRGAVHRSFPIRLRVLRFWPTLSQYRLQHATDAVQYAARTTGVLHPSLPRSEGERRRRRTALGLRNYITSRVPNFTLRADPDNLYRHYWQDLSDAVFTAPRETFDFSVPGNTFNFLTDLKSPGVEVIYDSGASGHVLNDKSLFDSDPTTISGPLLHGITGSVRVEGEGIFSCKAIGRNGKWSYFRGHAYYAPKCARSLISTQTLLRDAEGVHAGTPWLESVYSQGERPTITTVADTLTMENLHPYQPAIDVPLDVKSNLYIGTVYPTNYEIGTVPDTFGAQPNREDDDFEVNLTALDSENLNLSPAQKTLLEWHQRLGHFNFTSVQTLLRHRILTPNKSKHASNLAASRTEKCGCISCRYGKQSQRSKPGKTVIVDADKVMATKRDKLLPGQRVFVDHFHCDKNGRLESGTGVSDKTYVGGSIWVDAATGVVRVHLHTTFDTHETLLGKKIFEDWMKEHGVEKIEEYVSDGHSSFTSQDYQQHLSDNRQVQRFAPPGGHHHNGPAERAIGVLMNMSRTMLIHAALHWPEMADPALWPMAVTHAAHILNRLPRENTANRAPLELLTHSILDPNEYTDLHVWGSPVYVLEPGISKGSKIPRWKPRSRRGIYMGVSEKYSSCVPKVLNPHSGYITAQFHCLFDDWFFTAESNVDDVPDFTKKPWDLLFDCRFDWQASENPEEDTLLFGLDPEWTEEWQRHHATRTRQTATDADDYRDQREELHQQLQREPLPSRTSHQRERTSDGIPTDFDPSAWFDTPPKEDAPPAASETAPHEYDVDIIPFKNIPDTPQREIYSPSASEMQNTPFEDMPDPWANDSDNEPASPVKQPEVPVETPVETPVEIPAKLPKEKPPKRSRTPRRSNRTNKGVPAVRYADEFASLSSWQLEQMAEIVLGEVINSERTYEHRDEAMGIYLSSLQALNARTTVQPRRKKKSKSDPDTLSYWEVMKATDKDEFLKGMEVEFAELLKAGTFTIAMKKEAYESEAQVVPSTWTFRRKRNQFTGEVKRYKARLCLRGDLENNVTETYAPVGTWSTVRLMLTLAARYSYVTKCLDVSNAFVQAKLKNVKYMSIPVGAEHMPSLLALIPKGTKISDCCLKVHRSIYGAADAPLLYYKHCHEIFTTQLNLKQCSKDSCLYFGDGIAVSMYVDDKFIIANDSKKVDKFIAELEKIGLPITDEGEIAQYLGIKVTRSSDSFLLSQETLIEKVCKLVGLPAAREGTIKRLPAKGNEALGSDPEGDPFVEEWDYRSAIGMLLFIANNTRPDIMMSVSQAARYCASPKASHGIAVKRIARYLQDTKTQGLKMKPGNHLAIDAYVDSDFAGTWRSEHPSDPKSVKSRAGYVICFGGCPLVWKSQLIPETCLSTMMAEYIALSMCARQIVPLRTVAQELCKVFNLDSTVEARTHSVIFEDNNGALSLANAPQDTPQSKFYAVKYHWFREFVKNGDIVVKKIESKSNFGDLFTKVDPSTFLDLRKGFMGF